MLKIRRDADIDREQADGYVLRFHFSFKDFQNPAYDGFGALRLFNDDRKTGVLANHMHPHVDVEVVTYIVEGTFRHADNLGNAFDLPAGSVECLSAGTGIEHAEHNALPSDPLRMILMYFVPDTHGLAPTVTHQISTASDRANRWRHIAGPPGSDDTSVVIHQQADLYAVALTPQIRLQHSLAPRRGAYLYVISGNAQLDGETLATGDAAMITDLTSFSITAQTTCELLLVDVPLIAVSSETDAAIKGNVRVTDDVKDPTI